MLGNRYARLIGLDHKGASLWGAVEVQRSSNGFAEFPGEIPRSLKILEGGFCGDLLKQSPKKRVFSQQFTRLIQDGRFLCKQNLSRFKA